MIFKQIFDYIRKEKIISGMLICILSLILFSGLTQNRTSPADEKSLEEDRRIETTMELKKVSEAMMEKLQSNQPLMIKISLILTLILCMGILIDVLFILGLKEGYISSYRAASAHRVVWFAGDVFKAIVVLFFSEVVLSLMLVIFMKPLTFFIPDENAILMMTTFLRNIVVVLYVFHLVRTKYSASLCELGLTMKNFKKNMAIGLLSYIGFLPLYILLLIVVMGLLKVIGYEPPVQTVVQIVYEEENLTILFMFSLFIAFVGPVFEEIFFRGFIYQAFRRKWVLANGIVVSSILFALLHAHWVAILPIFALSVVLCLVFEKTGSLIPGTLLHMFHNTVALLIMFQVKAFQ